METKYLSIITDSSNHQILSNTPPDLENIKEHKKLKKTNQEKVLLGRKTHVSVLKVANQAAIVAEDNSSPTWARTSA